MQGMDKFMRKYNKELDLYVEVNYLNLLISFYVSFKNRTLSQTSSQLMDRRILQVKCGTTLYNTIITRASVLLRFYDKKI